MLSCSPGLAAAGGVEYGAIADLPGRAGVGIANLRPHNVHAARAEGAARRRTLAGGGRGAARRARRVARSVGPGRRAVTGSRQAAEGHQTPDKQGGTRHLQRCNSG
jgi:hypothetical protein